MRGVLLGAAFAFGMLASQVSADTTAATEQQPWQKAEALLSSVNAAFQANGVRAVQDYVPQIEEALAAAKQTYEATVEGGTTYVLTDGPADTLVSLLAGAADKTHKKGNVVAVHNPFPSLSLFLGSYYNEVGKPADAVRVLDKGLAVSGLSEYRPYLYSERGAALFGLKRWADALQSYDAGLAIESSDTASRARLLRGRGFALTELNRLDEAEKAYRDSLVLEPGNERALNELSYIAGLRAGQRPTETSIAPLQPQAPPQTQIPPQGSTPSSHD
jgi:tetratricopeptide (TPR) repeat protein